MSESTSPDLSALSARLGKSLLAPTRRARYDIPADMRACGVTGVVQGDDAECDVCGPTSRTVYTGSTTTRHLGTYTWTLCAHHVING